MSKPFCRKCLLEEIDRDGVYASIRELLHALPEDGRTEENEYRRRLELCKQCDFLIEGTCGMCGCFVELRAAKVNMHCPHEEHFW